MTINKRLHICCESPEGSIILRSGQQVGGLFHDDRLGFRTCQCRAHAPPRTPIFHPSQHALQLENVEEAAPHSSAQHFNPAKTPFRAFDEYQVLGGSPRADTELMTRFAEEITEVLKRLRSPIWYPLCESPSSLNQISIYSRVQGQGG